MWEVPRREGVCVVCEAAVCFCPHRLFRFREEITPGIKGVFCCTIVAREVDLCGKCMGVRLVCPGGGWYGMARRGWSCLAPGLPCRRPRWCDARDAAGP